MLTQMDMFAAEENLNEVEERGKKRIADWGRYYREFVWRQRFLGRWPFQTDSERKAAWRDWKCLSIYHVAE